MSLSDRLKKRNSKNALAALNESAEKLKGKKEEDKRFWKPERDKNGNFDGRVRFLDISEADEEAGRVPGNGFAYIIAHGFKGPGGWYFENSLKTHGKAVADPVSEYNGEQWKLSLEYGEEHPERKRLQSGCSNRGQKKSYTSNILIINDPTNPENNGKVFLYRYGAQIFKKIQAAGKPPYPSDPSFNPFDTFKGADFKLRVYTEEKGSGEKKKKWPNYERSEFLIPAALAGGDEAQIDTIMEQVYDLNPFDDPEGENFKTYDELKERLEKVIAEKVSHGSNSALEESMKTEEKTLDTTQADLSSASALDLGSDDGTKEPEKVAERAKEPVKDKPVDEEDDDDMSFFDDLDE